MVLGSALDPGIWFRYLGQMARRGLWEPRGSYFWRPIAFIGTVLSQLSDCQLGKLCVSNSLQVCWNMMQDEWELFLNFKCFILFLPFFFSVMLKSMALLVTCLCSDASLEWWCMKLHCYGQLHFLFTFVLFFSSNLAALLMRNVCIDMNIECSDPYLCFSALPVN